MRPVCESLYWLLHLAKTQHPICFLHSISSDDYLEDHTTIPQGFVGVWDKPLLDTWGHAPCKDVLSNYTGSSPYFGKVGSDTLFCGEKK